MTDAAPGPNLSLRELNLATAYVPAMGAAVTVLEVVAPLLWPPLHLVAVDVIDRATAWRMTPEPLRFVLESWVTVAWSWHGAALLFLLNTSAFAAVFLLAIALLRRAMKEDVP